jgi:hypothetical protein
LRRYSLVYGFTVVHQQVGYRDLVTSVEVVVVLAGVPLAIMVVLGLFTLRPFARAPRWGPGDDWNFPAVLWIAKPEALRRDSASRGTGGARGGARGEW